MKFQIAKEAFLDGLQQVQSVVSARTTLPILSNVLLEAKEGGGLRLTTTDLDVGVSGEVPAEVKKGGSTTLPARRLATIIRELPAEIVSVEVDSKNVAAIRSGQSRFKILGLADDEFPSLPDLSGAREFTIEQAVLKDGLRKTSYAISTDETRYVLNGIYFSFKDNMVTMVATDGRRLAMVEYALEFPESSECEIIVPTKAVNELQRLLDSEGEIKMLVGASQVAFELDGTVLISKLIEGNYPNFRQVIPGEPKHRIIVDRETLQSVVSRISLLASDKSNSVKLTFFDDNIDVEANSPDIGEAQEQLPVKYDGEKISIAFNPDFLQAPLRNLDTDEVYIDLIDEMNPGIIRNNSSFLYVIMPMRVSG